jgi:predicted Zn-dependent peptidase
LPNDEFELARQLAIDDILSLDDNPRRKVMIKLREDFYPSPIGRSTLGKIEDLQNLTAEQTKLLIQERFDPSGIIFSVAGKYNFESICQQMESLFCRDSKRKQEEEIILKRKSGKYTHINNEGSQVHIGLMTETVRPIDDGYYDARVAVSVLSGGMSARLFTEVREKRGLCYAIGARYHSFKDAAGIMCYAGTTPDKVQETHDVIKREFRNLCEGISTEEIERAKVGLKSVLILQSESSGSRAGSIASDYYMLGRVRNLDEIKEEIEKTSIESVVDFLKKNPFNEFTVCTIGPTPLEVDKT